MNHAGTGAPGPDRAGDRATTDPTGRSAGPRSPLGAAAGLLELAGRLRRAPSGISFIYDALEVLAAQYGLRDAVLVVDDTPIGRQAFRLRREPLPGGPSDTSGRWIRDALAGDAGLHSDPPAVDPAARRYVEDLAATALCLDVLAHDAGHDALTGLLNRRSYEAALAGAIGRAQRYEWPFALVLLDLDNFKAVNDELGHAAGDEALRIIGAEVRAVLRSGDLAARLGGDEFALILLNADSADVLHPLAERLRAALDRFRPTSGIRFSAGVAAFPNDATDADSLLRVADQRLYADKASVA